MVRMTGVRYALCAAIAQGSLECVATALARGADPNERDDDGTPPLHHAADRGSAALALLLLCYGSDPNACDASGATVLHRAALNAHAGVVALLLRYGADPNAVDSYGETPLHYLGFDCEEETIAMLLAFGADPCARDAAGATASQRILERAGVGLGALISPLRDNAPQVEVCPRCEGPIRSAPSNKSSRPMA
jgi:ankyrin repeat protein